MEDLDFESPRKKTRYERLQGQNTMSMQGINTMATNVNQGGMIIANSGNTLGAGPMSGGGFRMLNAGNRFPTKISAGQPRYVSSVVRNPVLRLINAPRMQNPNIQINQMNQMNQSGYQQMNCPAGRKPKDYCICRNGCVPGKCSCLAKGRECHAACVCKGLASHTQNDYLDCENGCGAKLRPHRYKQHVVTCGRRTSVCDAPPNYFDPQDAFEAAGGFDDGTEFIELPTAPRAARMQDDDSIPHTGPFSAKVSNLKYDLSESDVDEFFMEREIRIKEMRLTRDPAKCLSGSGHIEFETHRDLLDALMLPNPIIQGRPFRIELAGENDQRDGRTVRKRYDNYVARDDKNESTNWRDRGGYQNRSPSFQNRHDNNNQSPPPERRRFNDRREDDRRDGGDRRGGARDRYERRDRPRQFKDNRNRNFNNRDQGYRSGSMGLLGGNPSFYNRNVTGPVINNVSGVVNLYLPAPPSHQDHPQIHAPYEVHPEAREADTGAPAPTSRHSSTKASPAEPLEAEISRPNSPDPAEVIPQNVAYETSGKLRNKVVRPREIGLGTVVDKIPMFSCPKFFLMLNDRQQYESQFDKDAVAFIDVAVWTRQNSADPTCDKHMLYGCLGIRPGDVKPRDRRGNQLFHALMWCYFGEGRGNRLGQVPARAIDYLQSGKYRKAHLRLKGLRMVLHVILKGYTKEQVVYFEFCILKHFNMLYLSNMKKGHFPERFAFYEWEARKNAGEPATDTWRDLKDPKITSVVARYILNIAYELLVTNPPTAVDIESYDTDLNDKDRQELINVQRRRGALRHQLPARTKPN